MTAVDCYDVAIASLGIYCTMTKVPCGQFVHDYGEAGILRLTYFGQNLAGAQRWNLRMVQAKDAWVVGRSDWDGNWVNDKDEALDVTLTPTIWNLLKRVALLEGNVCANVNAAIVSVQESGKVLQEKVAVVEEKRKQHADYVSQLVDAQHREHLEIVQGVKKVEQIDTKVAELAESAQALKESTRLATKEISDSLSQRVDAIAQELSVEIGKLKEKMHYATVKKEQDKAEDLPDQIEVLRSTLGSCLLRNEELGASCSRLTSDVCLLRREVGNLSRPPREIVDLCAAAGAGLEPGEVPECTCKRIRT